MTRKLNIAITLNLDSAQGQSIWFNGANQHCVFLAMLLRSLPGVGKVWLAHNPGAVASPGMLLDELADGLAPLHDVIGELDVLIEMNAGIGPDHVAAVRQRGGKIVAYRFGNEYVMAVEGTCFGTHDWRPNLNRIRPDCLWTNPQHEYSCRGFFEEVYRAPVKVLPHLWSPYFVDRSLQDEPALREGWAWRRPEESFRIGVFEPNLNFVKCALLPLLLCDRAYRERGDLIGHVYLTNADQIKDNPAFSHIALGTDLVQAGRATVEPRYPFVAFAARHIDAVVTHQWENALNYLYFEALYGGYPLIHNSSMLGAAGYRYSGFDVGEGARMLCRAIEGHERNLAAYARRAALCLAAFDPASEKVRAAYARALLELAP